VDLEAKGGGTVTARRNGLGNRLHPWLDIRRIVGTRGKEGHSLRKSGDEGSRGLQEVSKRVWD